MAIERNRFCSEWSQPENFLSTKNRFCSERSQTRTIPYHKTPQCCCVTQNGLWRQINENQTQPTLGLWLKVINAKPESQVGATSTPETHDVLRNMRYMRCQQPLNCRWPWHCQLMDECCLSATWAWCERSCLLTHHTSWLVHEATL